MLPGHHAVPFLAVNTYYCMIFYVPDGNPPENLPPPPPENPPPPPPENPPPPLPTENQLLVLAELNRLT